MHGMDVAAIEAFFADVFPAAVETGIRVEAVPTRGSVLSWEVGEAHLRPGGTVSGPTLMTLADTGAYVAILGAIGPAALAVTTNLEFHFLRKAVAGRLDATTRLVRLGRRLAVAQVDVSQDGELVGMATVTYALP